MNTREQFGKYLLLKKLGEDPLGETFRAGKLSDRGIDQVVLLRVFNGQGLESHQLWRTVADRGVLQEGLKSPNLGNGVDFGEIQGVPFVAYDYISGATLAKLMAEVERQRTPLPLDHALLITERISLGLLAAYETRLGDDRVLHGFVVPELVMISNEGEARLLGLEMAPGLREQASRSPAARSFARFLSPETLAGTGPDKADDIYSLGAILYELLAGNPLQTNAEGDSETVVEQLKESTEGEPISPAIRQLLKQSLTARERRISDVANWHKRLSQLMIEGQYNPTTFNLAFFMHSLFREEIERENREMQSEQKLDAPALTMEMPVPPPVPATGDSTTETVMMRDVPIAREVEPKKEKKSWLPLVAALLLLAVVGGGAAYYFLVLQKQAPPEEQMAAADPAAMANQPPVLPAGPSAEEIQQELDRIKEEMQQEMAKVLNQQEEEYQERLKALQGQAEEAQKALEQRQRLEEEAAQREREREDARKQAEPDKAPSSAEKPADKVAAVTPKEASTEGETKTPASETAGDGGASSAMAKPAETTAAPATKTPPPPPVRTAPKEPEVRVGELVEPGPGVVQARLIKQGTARYPPAARRVGRTAKITVRVLVDENGKVIRVEQMGKKIGMGLDQAALDAARDCEFQPATKNGVRVKMWSQVQYSFE